MSMLQQILTALPRLTPEDRKEAEAILAELGITANAKPDLAELRRAAAEAWQADMQPVCDALAAALQSDDLTALQGFKALLPELLEEVNQAPALADLLALQLGHTVLQGMQAQPEART